MNRRNWMGLSPSSAVATPQQNRETASAVSERPLRGGRCFDVEVSACRFAGLANCPLGSFIMFVCLQRLGVAVRSALRRAISGATGASCTKQPSCQTVTDNTINSLRVNKGRSAAARGGLLRTAATHCGCQLSGNLSLRDAPVRLVVGWIRRAVIDRAHSARCASQAVRLVAKHRAQLAGLKAYGGTPLVRAACVTAANASPTPARTTSRSGRLSLIRRGCS